MRPTAPNDAAGRAMRRHGGLRTALADGSRGAAPLDAAAAQLLGWLVLAAVNAVVIGLTLEPPRALGVRLAHHLYDLGHMLAAGLVAAAAVRAWQRWGRRGALAKLLASMAVAFVVDGLLLGDDLGPRAVKLAGPVPASLWLAVLTLAAASSLPAAIALGALLRRPAFRWLGVLAAVQLAAANHLMLERNYPGVHLQLAWASATLVAGCLTGSELRPLAERWRRARLALHALACVLAAWSLVARPSSGVMVRLLSRSGSALAPFVARAHAIVAAARLDEQYRSSLSERSTPVPPTEPALLPSGPVVVLVTIDALRADLLDSGARAAALPTLHALRDEAVWFTNARTPAPASIVALASVFSGRYFSQLLWTPYQLDWQPFPHADRTPRLPALLSPAGITTATFHGFEWMTPETGIVGRFDEHVFVAPGPDYRERHFTEASRLVDAATARLARQGDGPLFLYLHFLEAHAPYDLVDAGTPFERYLGELGIVDRQLARLVAALGEPRLAKRTVLIVAADHGEAFGEHHAQYHGVTIYDELARVPLLIRAPSVARARIDAPVSLMDLGPTVLDLFGVPTPGAFQGQSLVPLLAGRPPKLDRPVAIDSGRLVRALVFADGYKIIHDRRRDTVELYDLRADPAELDNLVDVLPAEAAQRLGILLTFFGPRELRRPGYQTPFRPP